MARLAWFTPWPPQASGVAGRSAELVPRLAARGYGIDVFVDERVVPAGRGAADPPAPGTVRVLGAHDFVWRQARGAYDLTVYQLGNSSVHDFTWPYLFRWPGLVVLHDTCLHHARALSLLGRRRLEAYRAEFAWNHPDVDVAAATLAIRGFGGCYYYGWPMRRTVVESARMIAVHARSACRDLQAEWPDRAIAYIPLGEGAAAPPGAGARFRTTRGLPDRTILFGIFGALTEEKRVGQVLRAMTAARARDLDVHLVLAGHPAPELRLPSLIEAHGLARDVTVLPALGDEAFDEAIAAMDVCLCLRWPSAGETSGPWLRALANARPTIITDLTGVSGLPTLDPRTWRLHAPAADTSPEAESRAAAVAVDVLDEEHSLRLAMRRLATDADLRDRIGRAGRAYWEREHTVPLMVDGYLRAIEAARAQPIPSPALPPHLRPDPSARARSMLEPFGRSLPF